MGLPAKSPQAILWGPREGGGATFPARCALYFTFEHDEPSESARSARGSCPQTGQEKSTFHKELFWRLKQPQPKIKDFRPGTPKGLEPP